MVAASLLLASCAAPAVTAGTEPLTPAQQQLQQANTRFAQTVGEGALLGALLGAGLGYAFGGNHPGTAIALGAGAGALAGAGAGYAVARKNYARAQTESNLQKVIVEAQADANAYARSANASATIAREARAQAASLNGQLAARSIDAGQYRRKMASYHDSADIMHKQIAQMDSEGAALRADAGDTGGEARQQMLVNARSIDRSRQAMEQNLQVLESALAAEPGA